MHIISQKALREFAAIHPDAHPGLDHWYQVMRKGTFHNLAEIRRVLLSTDMVGAYYVFNIGSNTARLIAAIHFNRQRLFIRAILTHAEYDKDY
jgi:mRNA interferase HigB